MSTRDPSRIVFSGGVVGDNLGQFYGAVVSAIAPSRMEKGVVWAGTNDGKVWISRDAGKNWNDLSKNVNMPPWGIVRRIDASHFDPGTAYMAVDYHLVDNRDPYLFKTSDFGQTWTRIDATLPKGHPLDYTLSIAENPHRRGMVFAGTGHAFFYSKDDGKTWTQFKDKLPAGPVNWIEVPKNAAEVVVATYGRGVWILRDVWQLEMDAQAASPAAQDFQLLKPLPGIRRASAGTAEFVFNLPAAPTSPVTVEILGADGAVLQHESGAGARRTQPLVLEPADGGAQPAGAAVDPAGQSVHLGRRALAESRAAGHALGARRAALAAARGARQVQRPHDLQRPATHATVRDLARRDAAVHRRRPGGRHEPAEEPRDHGQRSRRSHQPHRNHARAGRRPAQGSTRPTRRWTARWPRIYKRMYDTELHYLSRTEMHSDDKWYVEKYKLYMNLVWLLAEVGGSGGDVAGGVAYAPTQAALNVYEERLKEMTAARAAFTKLMQEVEAFNKANAGKLPAISDKLPGR